MGKFPYYINGMRVRGTHCLVINDDINHGVRLVYMLDKLGPLLGIRLDFDVISLIYDSYRSRLNDLPKPFKDIPYPFPMVFNCTPNSTRARGSHVSLERQPSVQSGDPIIRGFKGVYEKNLRLTMLLLSTREFYMDNPPCHRPFKKMIRRNRIMGTGLINIQSLEKQFMG